MTSKLLQIANTTSNGNLNSALDFSNGATSWELALVTTSTFGLSVQVESKLVMSIFLIIVCSFLDGDRTYSLTQ